MVLDAAVDLPIPIEKSGEVLIDGGRHRLNLPSLAFYIGGQNRREDAK
jgi:hypothetical protein